MRRLLFLLTIPCLLAADDHWVKFTRGPFEVMTDAAPRAARETLVRFEEFRHALGQIVGEDDLQTPLPVRIFVFKNAQGLDLHRAHHRRPRPLRHRARREEPGDAGNLHRAGPPLSEEQHRTDARRPSSAA